VAVLVEEEAQLVVEQIIPMAQTVDLVVGAVRMVQMRFPLD
jgi:hypothetical protein